MAVVIYRTEFFNPAGELRVYIGIHNDESKHPLWRPDIVSGYIGSSSIAQTDGGNTIKTLKPGWKHLLTKVIYECKSLEEYSKEDEFIRQAWCELGVAPEALRAAEYRGVKLNEFEEGICINVQTSNLSAIQTHEAKLKAFKTRLASGAHQRWMDAAHSKQAAAKSINTRLRNGSHQKALDAAHAVSSREKAKQTMILADKYKQSTKEAVAAAWSSEVSERRHATRIANRVKYQLSDGFIGDYIACADHIGCSPGTFSNWVSGRRKLSSKYGCWEVRINE